LKIKELIAKARKYESLNVVLFRKTRILELKNYKELKEETYG